MSGSRTAVGLLGRLTRSHWPSLAVLGLLGLASVPLALATPLPLRIAVDSVLGGAPLPEFLEPLAGDAEGHAALALCVALVLGIALVSLALSVSSAVLRARIGERMTLSLHEELYPHVQRIALRFHEARGSSDTVYRVLYDSKAVPTALLDGLLPLVTAALTLVGVGIVTFILSWKLALVALAIAPALALLTPYFSRRLRRQASLQRDLVSSGQAALAEVLGMLRVVVAFGREERERARLFALADGAARAGVRLATWRSLFELAIGLVAAGGTAAVLLVGVLEVRAEHLSLGDLLVVLAYIGLVHSALQTVMRKLGEVQASLIAVERVSELLSVPPAVVERPGAVPLARARGALELERVSFGFEPGRPVLRELSLAIAPGSCVGITGVTGAGKTTLLSLVLRLEDPDSGRILLDGVDLRELRLADLRRQLAVVTQETILLSGTIAENVAYGDPSADPERIGRALTNAGLAELVAGLPKGPATEVGERGLGLSGGERQRVALARAFVRDAPILLLDEPTSALDARTEVEVLGALRRLVQGRTALIVSHSPPLLELCGRVVELQDGLAVSLPHPAGLRPPGRASG